MIRCVDSNTADVLKTVTNVTRPQRAMIHVRLSESDVNHIDRHAAARGLNRSEFIRVVLRAALAGVSDANAE